MRRLTEQEITEIVYLHKQGMPGVELAKKYNTTSCTISTTISRELKRPKPDPYVPFIPDPTKPKINRPPAVYSNFQREDYIDKLLREK